MWVVINVYIINLTYAVHDGGVPLPLNLFSNAGDT